MSAPRIVSPQRRIILRAGTAALATTTLGLPGLVRAAAGGPGHEGIAGRDALGRSETPP